MSKKTDILIEIGTEELPPTEIKKISYAFKELFQKQLDSNLFNYDSLDNFGTPRRLAVRINKINKIQESQMIIKKGPSVKAAFDKNKKPTPALIGFTKSCDASIEELEEIETPKGLWLQYKKLQEGKTIDDCLENILKEIITDLPFKKKMKWDDSGISFSRPIKWISVSSNNSFKPLKIGNYITSNKSFGHSIHSPKNFEITPDTYEKVLMENYVIASIEKRKTKIEEEIEKECKKINLTPLLDKNLLDEVTGLVEWPVILIGTFHEKFLKIPKEALIAAMQEHQRCFALKKSGKLSNHFIITSNIESLDKNIVILGNEKVMEARLSDALFLFEQDTKKPIEYFIEKLKTVTFQRKLGTLFDKTLRISNLSKEIGKVLNNSSEFLNNLEKATYLCKFDLMSQMVYEFPELQGIIGKYYSKIYNYNDDIAESIEEHYLPKFSKDNLPQNEIGTIVSLADKMDTLVGIIGIGKKPSGDSDPFSLRRQAVGIIRILVEKKLDLNLQDLIDLSLNSYNDSIINKQTVNKNLLNFFLERLKGYFNTFSPNLLEAVISQEKGNLYDIHKRLISLKDFSSQDSFAILAEANKRVKNILSKNNEKLCDLQENLLQKEEEKLLHLEIVNIKQKIEPLLEQKDYNKVLITLSKLRKPISDFFDNVMVMDNDEAIKQNRIALLHSLRNVFLTVADLSKI